ncbi:MULTISPECIES: helix-turn-helix domain-containing protein [Asanoa]|uniref:Transcriptional regulator, contains XRE-family HTH domain n=2 Tax=Asanoa TaxID=195964 RepID=A0A239PH26_9ACTN|nr:MULTISPECIES: helix-turn-helix transcriptional regulator [Asanoa]GIF74237.1 transcriptional regulator [Asanoa siamensis]SNT66272.1 Transcriptional regulator, contains XRE-family HTH domain [Asanoa hainanensis]
MEQVAEPTILRGIGANIATHRRAASVTQSDLAARIGKSVQWVSAVEQGRRHADRLTDLIRIAQVVGCAVEDLIGRPVETLARGGHPRADAVSAVREVIMRAAVPIPRAELVPDLEDVSTRVADAWTVWHQSPTAHSILGGVLPSLIRDANAAYRHGSDPRAAARNLSGAYQITRQWLHHVPDGDLAWVAAERAMSAAREADDPHLIALGAWALSASYRRAGQQDEATRLCLAAADELRTRLNDDDPQTDLLADYGMLHLAAAVSAAQSDEDGRAWALHRVADDAARALGARYDPWTAFGRGNVDIHGLAISAELGKADSVVDYASRLEIDNVPSVERRAAALINTARGYVRRREDESAALVLLDAENISRDEVHDSTLVRELLLELLHRDRARARAHIRGLAQRCGLIAA